MNLSRLGITERQLPYEQYRSEARNADILLWRPVGLWTRLVARGTHGPWCHAAGVRWFRNGTDRLISMQYKEGMGGYMAPTRDEVARYPGKADVFRVTSIDDATRDAIADQLLDTLGGEYAWSNIRAIAWMYAPGLRWLADVPAVADWLEGRLAETGSMICSSHIAAGYWHHKIPFVKRPTGMVSPNDIGRSGVTSYVGTLV